jgi:hypothetical protein
MPDRSVDRHREAALANANRISVPWTLARVCCLVLLLVLFNRHPGRIGVIVSADDPSSFVPLLAPEFLAGLLLRLNLWCGLSLALYVVNLWVGRWTWGTRLAGYALTFFGMLILAKTISSPLLGTSPQWLQSAPSAVSVAERVVPLLAWLVKGTLATALIAWLVLLAAEVQALRRAMSLTAA